MSTKDGRPRSADRVRRAESADVSWASAPAVRVRMQDQRARDTKPELAVRRLIHARGLRYRVDQAPLAGLRRRADIVFRRAKVAVFIDGCFWHGCPVHGTSPKANAEFWSTKIAGNRARDENTDDRLRDAGWCVIRAWEHEDPLAVADRVVAAVEWRRGESNP